MFCIRACIHCTKTPILPVSEAVFVSRVLRMTRIFAPQTRRFSAAILGGLQGKSTQYAGKKAVQTVCNAYENGFLCGTKKAAPRSVPWDGCNITAVPPKLHTAFCRMPLDAPITWGRPGGDYSCFPASAQKRQHAAPPYRVFSSPRLSGWRKRRTLFFLAFIKRI